MKWISIKDRLPTEADGYRGYGYVLIYTTGRGRNSRKAGLTASSWGVANVMYVEHNAKKGWYTHWAELTIPKNPEEPK